jgi:DNA-binding SARP family transcriptional activator
VAVETRIQRVARPALAQSLADALETGSVLLIAGAGYGKTTAIEQAIEASGRRAVWVTCRDGGDPGRLLVGALEGLRGAVPGLADVVWDRLTTRGESWDVASAASALVSELERLLVEPLILVLDDAEELEEGSLALVDQLLNAPLSLAIATRRPLALKLAKLRAAGRLTEVGPSELSFDASEAEELLRLRRGRPVTHEEVDAAITATEGWPMGLALGGVSHEDLFRFLAEEVLDRLDPAMRRAVIDSSVAATLTPADAEAERLGLFLRARSYHPLFRSFLLERLNDERSDTERAALHARAAAALAADGRHGEAIDHWLEAGDFRAALAALTAHGPILLRISPATATRWLEAFPREFHDEPDYRFLEAQLLWGSGRHESALEPLRAAVAGYRERKDVQREWLARVALADALMSAGAFEEIDGLTDGWQSVRIAGPAVAWYQAMALGSRGLPEQATALAERLRADPATAHFLALDAVVRVGVDLAAGHGRATLAWLDDAIAKLDRDDDPQGQLPYALNMRVLVLRDLGEREAALEGLDRCEGESERVGLGFVARDCQLQRAMLLEELPRAEIELARAGHRRGAGWRGLHRELAEAHVAALRGDVTGAVDASRRALERVAPGPPCFRVWAALEVVAIAPEVARPAIDELLAELPRDHARLHRARLLAARAHLEHTRGESEVAGESVRRCWEEAGEEADQVVRAHWRTLRPVLWHALETGAVAPEAVLGAMQGAFPGGEALVAMVDHPHATVRRAALGAALAADHPAVLADLAALGKDGDEQVAAAAAAARGRLRADPPPLRFELLGGFVVKRAGWELDEATWKRPMAARVVRFLLLQESAVPEDALFEAFWSDRPAEQARQHLAVAVSRARKVLDLPGADSSVIEARERTYRLRLRDRDSVDSAAFESAAANARERAGLERAAALWTGEPLPEDRYAPWSFAWRERLTETYRQVLTALIGGYERSGEHHEVIRAAQHLLAVDPLDEHAHRQLMTAYARSGRTSYALRQYLECRRALVTQLGVEPSAETSGLQARILAGGPV